MKWRQLKRALLSVMGLICFNSMAIDITDQRGVTVHFDKSPQRVVSLLPSLTEGVCALDQCARLIGVDRYSNSPASVLKLPKLGGGIDPSIEAVVALKPDVVLLAISSRASERFESLGVKVLALEPRSHADVQKVLTKLGDLFEVPADKGAQRVWRVIDAAVQAAAQSVDARARNTRVYFEVNRGPYAASEASFIGETLTRLGVKNVVPGSMGPFPRLNPEFVVRANPDLIMVGNRSMVAMSTYPGWQGIKAIRNNNICAFTVEEADVLVRPGPRMDEAARIMANCINRQFSKGIDGAATGKARP